MAGIRRPLADLRPLKRDRDRGWLVCGIGFAGLAGSLVIMHAQVEKDANEGYSAKEGDQLVPSGNALRIVHAADVSRHGKIRVNPNAGPKG